MKGRRHTEERISIHSHIPHKPLDPGQRSTSPTPWCSVQGRWRRRRWCIHCCRSRSLYTLCSCFCVPHCKHAWHGTPHADGASGCAARVHAWHCRAAAAVLDLPLRVGEAGANMDGPGPDVTCRMPDRQIPFPLCYAERPPNAWRRRGTHKRQETPTNNLTDRRPTHPTDQAPSTIERAARETHNTKTAAVHALAQQPAIITRTQQGHHQILSANAARCEA